VANVYAVGDVATGSMGLATMGQNQAARAVRALFSGATISKDKAVKPSAIWTIPELAWAGMSEEKAKADGIPFGVAKVDFKQTTRGCVANEDGFLKLVYNRENGVTLGVHLFGENSCELVNYGAEAVNNSTTIFSILRFIFPAVTYHNLYARAAAEGKLRINGQKNLAAATAWKKIYGLVEKSLASSGSSLSVSDALKKAFRYYDKERCGFITAAQLAEALESLGMDADNDDAEEMIYEATDGASSESLDYQTFLAVLKQNSDKFVGEEADGDDDKHPVQTPTDAPNATRNGTMFIGKALTDFARSSRLDAVVLGSGPAGLKAAAEIGARGKRVVLVDPKETVTGTPTGAHSKCLREAVLEGAATWEKVKTVIGKAMDNSGYEAKRLLHTFQVKHMRGYGTIQDENTVSFVGNNGEEKTLKTDAIIIATGSKANRFAPTSFELPGVYDSDNFQSIDRIPEKMVVQGAGIVSVEYALIFARLGTEVILVDAFPAFLPMLDSTLQETIKETLEDHDVEVLLNTPFKTVEAMEGSTPEKPGIRVHCGDRVLECDCLLSACGRSGNTQGLGLENLEAKGLKINPRGKLIEVDANGFTGVARVYAVGDVATGSMGLATMGQQQAVLAARALFSTSGLMDTEKAVKHKPSAVWTIPEVAWVGLTEEQAKKEGKDYNVVKVEFSQTIRGCVTNQEGYMKLIFERGTGLIFGVHLCGEMSSELVNYGAELVNGELTIFQVLHFVFPAVTYHQLYHDACAEAKIRFKGAKDLEGAAAWGNLRNRLQGKLPRTAYVTVTQMIEETFKKYDPDNSGFLTQDELREAVRSLGLDVSEASIRAMVLEAMGDERADEVDYKTILRMVTPKEEAQRRDGQRRNSKTRRGLMDRQVS